MSFYKDFGVFWNIQFRTLFQWKTNKNNWSLGFNTKKKQQNLSLKITIMIFTFSRNRPLLVHPLNPKYAWNIKSNKVHTIMCMISCQLVTYNNNVYPFSIPKINFAHELFAWKSLKGIRNWRSEIPSKYFISGQQSQSKCNYCIISIPYGGARQALYYYLKNKVVFSHQWFLIRRSLPYHRRPRINFLISTEWIAGMYCLFVTLFPLLLVLRVL